MTHLLDEELMHLAEVTEEQFIYNEHELEQMSHLKTCTYCYEKFCSALALLEVTSDSGYVVLSEIYAKKRAKAISRQVENKILAVVNIVRNKWIENMDVVLEQIGQKGATFSFEPVLTMATRGSLDNGSRVYKIEDMEDEKTFMIFDSQNNELFVQINTKGLGFSKVKVFIQMESGERTEIPLEMKGRIYKGIWKNLPMEKIQIVIEKEEC